MKRGYTALEYKQKIRKLRAVRPDISISSDFIVGFPGETERDFEATMNLIADVGFDQSFSFIYSRRPGTPAASLPDDVTHEEKQQRLELLQARSTRRRRRSAEAMVGTVQRVLVERPSRKKDRAARRPHREHALGELRRARDVDQSIRGRADHGGPANSLRGRSARERRSRRAARVLCSICDRLRRAAALSSTQSPEPPCTPA